MSTDFDWEFWLLRFKEVKNRDPKSDDELMDFADEQCLPLSEGDIIALEKELLG
jgi:hypothetical protein